MSSSLARNGVIARGLSAADHKKLVGDRLRLAREALGLTVAELARKYPHALTTYSKLVNYESGRSYPPPAWLAEFCDDFGLTMDFFYRGVRAGVSSDVADGLRKAVAEKQAVCSGVHPQRDAKKA